MRRLALAALLVFLALVVTGPATAQGLRISQPAPDCRLFRRAFDNPISDTKGYWQPRIAWHAEKATAGALGVFVLRRLHVPTRLAAWTPALLVTALHVRGVVRYRTPINPMDWIADAWMVSAGAVRPAPWLGGYAATGVCFASP